MEVEGEKSTGFRDVILKQRLQGPAQQLSSTLKAFMKGTSAGSKGPEKKELQ